MITEKTPLNDYPIIIAKYMEFHKGKPLNVTLANQIWDSLTEEEKAMNKDMRFVRERGSCYIYHNDKLICECVLYRN